MLIPILLAAAAAFLTYTYTKLRQTRYSQWAHIPQLPTSLIWGHIKIFGEYVKRQKPGADSDVGIGEMHKDLGYPPVIVVDIRPIARQLLIIANHDVAEQISRASSVFPLSGAPKERALLDRLFYMIGRTSILAAEGEEWKRLRRRFNPGFAPQYLNTFMPEVLDKGVRFLERLDARVKSQETFSLMALTMRLTFDIIGKVAMDTEFDSQHSEDKNRQGDMIRVYEELVGLYENEVLTVAWWLTPIKVFRRARVARRFHALLKDIVRQKHADLRRGKNDIDGKGTTTTTPRSVLSLSLQDVDTLTQEVLDETADQLRTFLFAGHDTTSILLSWVFYEISRSPHVLQALREEHDGLFGPDEKTPEEIRARLLENQVLLQNMPYTTAVIKETLRIHPPAGSGRAIPKGTGLMLRLPGGQEICADGFQLYISHRLIQSDREVYGDTAEQFIPERWLGSGEEEVTQKPIPVGAWRPFERGPRNCIGQELAYLEARVIIAMAVRRYDFVKVGLGEVLLDPGTGQPMLDPARNGRQYMVAEELYPTRNVTSKPVDGMLVKVRFAAGCQR